MRTIALRLGAVALVILAVTAWLVARAVQGVQREVAARHAAVVEDLFDEFEGELSEIVDREERRSFLEYRHLYVPDGVPGAAGLVRSPLAGVPEDPAIVGYFQVDPGGECTNPALPRDNELDAAVAAGWTPSDDLDARQAHIREVLAQIPSWDTPAPRVAAAVGPQEAQAPTVQLKRGASARDSRELDKKVQTKGVNLEAYNTEVDLLQNVWDANEQQVLDPEPDPDVDVGLTRLEGVRVGEDLVLHREVTIGGQRHRQGLVVHLPSLAERLERDVLAGSALDPFVALAWDGPPSSAAYMFTHAFAAPFQAWTVSASAPRIPELASREGWFLGGLAGLVVAVVLVGGASVWRAVRAELELAQRRSDFAAAVTHELKTPITTIRMYGEMLRDGLIPGAARQHEYHVTLVAEAERLTRLVGNVLELARIERGAAGPAPEDVDPVAIVREAHALCAPMVTAAGATLDLAVPEALPLVHAERDGLVQALANLVDNALKFSADAPDRRIHLSAAREGDRVALRVRDHGPGVPKGQLRQIFEPFYRGERELTRRTKGTGIGLALVAGVVERARGTVRARNHPDGGLEVTLELPQAR